MSVDTSRRTFVASLAAAGVTVAVPRKVHSLTRMPDKLRIACIGVGGMGYNDVKGVSGEALVAFADVDQKAAERAYRDFPQARRYTDFRELLDREHRNIDAVTISTPDHVHALAVMLALKAGKHVYCQKPLARTVGEVRAVMAEAARRPTQATQMGNQGHAGEGIRQIREWVEAGLIGTVQRVECWTNRPIWPQAINRPTDLHVPPPTFDWDRWLGPAAERPFHPRYAPFNWRGWWDFGTGAMGDMACHILDAPCWILDLRYPTRVTPESTRLFDETAPAASRVTYDFPARGDRPPVQIVWRDGNLNLPRPAGWPDARPWPYDETGGQLWIGDAGMLVAGTYAENPRLVDDAADAALRAAMPPVKYPRTEGVHKEWIAACKSGGQGGSSFAGYAGPLTEMILLGNLAVRMGRTLELDTATGAILGQQPPAAWVMPEYRAGWRW